MIFFILKLKEFKKLKKENHILKQYNEATKDSNIISTADLKGNITYVNDKFCEVSLYTYEEVLGKPHSIVRGEEDDEIFQQLWETIKNKKVWYGVLKNRKKNGEFYWVNINIRPILDEKNEIIEYIAIRHEITDLVLKTEELKRNLRLDSLTNIGNRYKLIEDVSKSVNPCISILDIVSFSDVNDFFGYKTGDNVLKIVARKIEELLIDKENYKVYRDHSDTFCIVAQNEDRDKFIKNIDEISKTIGKVPIVIKSRELYVQLSYVFSFESKENLLETANIIKRYSQANKNIIIYDKALELEKDYEKNIFWTLKIKKALDEDKIVPYFQPIYNLKTNKIEKYEALVRLIDGNNVISPYYFLDISKKSKQYLQLTKTMIQKTFDYFKDKDFEFSINLTFEDIKSEYISSFIIELLKEYKIGHRVVFEIVESEEIDNFRKINEFFVTIREYGCKIAIDDFGSGYSNFEYLAKLNVDYIKIDGSLIKDILINKSSQNIVSMLVNFAKGQKVKTIAEFVSNKDILNKVRELGIDYVQGYYIKEPIASIDGLNDIISLREFS
ncbi:EAL domain-containing protein [Aliarcobacter butzleri]|uniref:EAL domain-containing protein n=2 Tax=Aliarcobacter butzleri TaxID=28197 RepID=A0AAW7Q2T8_9BACT|nr:GGDEF domain-containing phosphodiesterase [Aliarcobacter butzleri]MCP3649835.1 EAL domain-containing protein [Arcobacter sp. DNRA7]MCR1816009.1 EAL domain-containing protein [Aliarcobacter butzleri]MDN5105442.1 EAL domain-containing protein [Aliarcobacter butzleri]MDN5107933.1 EAL domain-containing protein [Aliarcobacter butzleri]MDN5113819.1 EAL domain-containing protein [Aliarcobacter butzleri]